MASPIASSSSSGAKILVLSVELAPGVSKKIEVHEGDDTSELAAMFCRLHNLDSQIIGPLTKHIQNSVLQVAKAREAKKEKEAEDFQRDKGLPKRRPSTMRSPEPATKHELAKGPMASPPSRSRPTSAPLHRERSMSATPEPSYLAQSSLEPSGTESSGAERYDSGELRANDDPETSSGTFIPQRQRRDSIYTRLHKNAKTRSLRREELAAEGELKKKNATTTTPSSQDSEQNGRTIGRVFRPKSAGSVWAGSKTADSYLSRRSYGGTDYQNCGERLYVEGVLQREQRKVRAESALADRLREELKEVRDPQISKLGSSIKHPRSSWQRLTETSAAKSKDKKLQQMRRDAKLNEIKECSFQPELNKKSQRLMNDRVTALKEHKIPYHEQLFHDAERRRLRQEEYSNWFPEDHTFQPNLQSSSPSDLFFSSVLDRESEQQMVHRLSYVPKKHSKPDQLVTDDGREFFKPATGRAPQYQRNRARLPIGDYLYGMRYEFDDKKEFMMEQEIKKIKDGAETQYANPKSRKIMGNVMKRRFTAIFSFLDENEENVLELNDLDISMLDEEVQDDVEETRRRMTRNSADHSASVTLDEFIEEMEHTVANGRRRYPRGYLFSTSGRDPDDNEPSHHPKITKKSKELAQVRRIEGVPVEDMLLQSKKDWDRKVELRRKQKEEAEMSECTFKPRLNSRKAKGKAMILAKRANMISPPPNGTPFSIPRGIERASPRQRTPEMSVTLEFQEPVEMEEITQSQPTTKTKATPKFRRSKREEVSNPPLMEMELSEDIIMKQAEELLRRNTIY